MRIAAFVPALCVFAFLPARGLSGGAVERSFTLSADPDETVIKLEVTGPAFQRPAVVSIYADGRVAFDSPEGPVARVVSPVPRSLEGLESLVNSAISAGLLDIDGQEIYRRITAARGAKGLPKMMDSSSAVLEISLADYRAGERSGPLRHQIALQSPKRLSELVPHLTELRALADLEDEIWDQGKALDTAEKARNER